MDEFLKTTFGKSLRWLAVIPGAFLAMVLAPILFNLVWYTTSYRVGDETILFYLFRTFVAAGVGPCAYIYIGSKIAPSFRRIVSVSLGIIYITLFILTLLGVMELEFDIFELIGLAGGWKLIVSALFSLAGSVFGVSMIWDEHGLKD